MSTSAADGPHEFVVAPELAEVAKRLGVPLHAGDRVRVEVVDGKPDAAPRRRLSWLGSVSSGGHTLSERAKDDTRPARRTLSEVFAAVRTTSPAGRPA